MFINIYIGNNENKEVVYEKKNNNNHNDITFINIFNSTSENVSRN